MVSKSTDPSGSYDEQQDLARIPMEFGEIPSRNRNSASISRTAQVVNATCDSISVTPVPGLRLKKNSDTGASDAVSPRGRFGLPIAIYRIFFRVLRHKSPVSTYNHAQTIWGEGLAGVSRGQGVLVCSQITFLSKRYPLSV